MVWRLPEVAGVGAIGSGCLPLIIIVIPRTISTKITIENN